MINYIGMVREFHEKYDHYISTSPQTHYTLQEITVSLRFRLIQEEFNEFQEARTTEEIADSLGDLLYVVFGAALTYGIPIDEVFTEIHRSNMTKTIEKNEFGKTIKGPNWEPPNLKKILGG